MCSKITVKEKVSIKRDIKKKTNSNILNLTTTVTIFMLLSHCKV